MTSLPPDDLPGHDLREHSLPEHNTPPEDPLIALWQTAPSPDPHNLVEETQRLDRLHKRLYRSLLAILYGLGVLLTFEEATGRLPTRGLISVAWLVMVTGEVWRKRTRCNRPAALTLDTASLLKAMIARAKKDLRLARNLYLGAPCGAVAGVVVMRFLMRFPVIRAGTASRPVGPHLEMVQTGAGLAALAVMVIAGLVLARSRSVQAKELSEKLKSIESDL
jgi:hypothetical protein